MKMKKTLVVLLSVLVLTMGYFKGFCADEEAKQTPLKKAWELGTRFSTHPELYQKWYNDLEKRVKEKKDRGTAWDPVIIEFNNLINSDPIIRMYITKMIEQSHCVDSERKPHLKNIDDMLEKIDAVLTTAPKYEDSGLVGFPINAILIDTMATPAGYAAFRNEKINSMFKKIIDRWATYLRSPESREVIKTSWNCPEAKEKLKMEQYKKYNPKDLYWGYDSWNDFFIRELKDGQRPIAEPGNNKVIVSACDSQIFQIYNNVKNSDRFWIKSQPYSLDDMFGNEGKFYVDQFKGGDVYQAFLCAFDYHRWHSPVSGTIKAAYLIPGTYYSQAEAVGVDPSGPDLSQGYIAQTAARAMILIQADDPAIGLMAVMPVGMGEVSSCVFNENTKPGKWVKKGNELGYFQYGGSTHCLIFRPGVIKEFTLQKDAKVKMGRQIAVAN
ncbi:MAG: phosphatidylserine decarboxylase family protein [Candidatus Aminicenantes bacterium]|nr:phosphatidylserine decarboxylase family protein [Candidatus Aminicenantes bacterium]